MLKVQNVGGNLSTGQLMIKRVKLSEDLKASTQKRQEINITSFGILKLLESTKSIILGK